MSKFFNYLFFLAVTIMTLHRFFLIIRNQSNCRDENETDSRYFFHVQIR